MWFSVGSKLAVEEKEYGEQDHARQHEEMSARECY